MPPQKRSAAATLSGEVGEEDQAIMHDNRSGRPKRKRVRRSPLDSPFLDSAVAVSDPEESEHSDEGEVITVPHRRRQPISRIPLPSLDVLSGDSEADSNMSGSVAVTSRKSIQDVTAYPPVSATAQGVAPAFSLTISNLVVNVPAGHTGSVCLHLDIPELKQTPGCNASTPKVRRSRRDTRSVPKAEGYPGTGRGEDATSASASRSSRRAGFLDLPSELRNEIYAHAFVASQPLRLRNPNNFQLSAAFLRTCRQVHEEGRTLLYMENTFHFSRRSARYGSYWNDEWNELGFKPVRCFLKMIGPVNTGLLRHVQLHCEDAMPCLNPDMHTADERRFTKDEVLLSCLRYLAKHGRLKTLELNFNGRRRLDRVDSHFLDHLAGLRADRVEFVDAGNPPYLLPSKHSAFVEGICWKRIVRREKMYPQFV